MKRFLNILLVFCLSLFVMSCDLFGKKEDDVLTKEAFADLLNNSQDFYDGKSYTALLRLHDVSKPASDDLVLSFEYNDKGDLHVPTDNYYYTKIDDLYYEIKVENMNWVAFLVTKSYYDMAFSFNSKLDDGLMAALASSFDKIELVSYDKNAKSVEFKLNDFTYEDSTGSIIMKIENGNIAEAKIYTLLGENEIETTIQISKVGSTSFTIPTVSAYKMNSSFVSYIKTELSESMLTISTSSLTKAYDNVLETYIYSITYPQSREYVFYDNNEHILKHIYMDNGVMKIDNDDSIKTSYDNFCSEFTDALNTATFTAPNVFTAYLGLSEITATFTIYGYETITFETKEVTGTIDLLAGMGYIPEPYRSEIYK